MFRNLTWLVLSMAVIVRPAIGAQWYAAPNAKPTGDGSFFRPWPLQVALTATEKVRPGDVINLRSGQYQGPGFISLLSGTSNANVTVRSRPGEWAVITDGSSGTLLSPLGSAAPNSSSFNVTIAGSEDWTEGTLLIMENEQIQLLKRQANPTNWQVCRGWSSTQPASHSIGTKMFPRGDFINHRGSYVIFRDFEITSTLLTNRVVTATNYLGCGLNLTASGKANKAVNLVVHNVGHPGIGFWQQGEGGEINGCIMWGNGIYDNDGTWTRGNGVYAQNRDGTVILKNNIVFRNFTYGMKGFGETGPVKGFRFINNLAFDSPVGFPLEISSGSTPMDDNAMWTNYVLGNIMAGYVSVSNTHQSLIGNWIVNGGLGAKEFISGTYSNNLVLLPYTPTERGLVTYLAPSIDRAQAKFVWDWNQYYLAAGSRPRQWAFRTQNGSTYGSDGSGNLVFDGDKTNSWKDFSGFDQHSLLQTNWPSDLIKVEALPLDYDANRHHIVVIATTGQTNVLLDLGKLGFAIGDRYELRDAQNYFRVIASGSFMDEQLSLPLDLMEVGPIKGTITHFSNKHTNSDAPGLFNVFVLRKISPRPVEPTNVRVTTQPDFGL
ncbi:MAG TPA: hypothetical protein VN673_17775 [Clostridia bacterium]|nr:hypothetical protein [Clostridia bacterium]